MKNKVIQSKGGNRVHATSEDSSRSSDSKQLLDEDALPMTISSIIQVSQNLKDFSSRMYNHSRRQYIRKVCHKISLVRKHSHMLRTN